MAPDDGKYRILDENRADSLQVGSRIHSRKHLLAQDFQGWDGEGLSNVRQREDATVPSQEESRKDNRSVMTSEEQGYLNFLERENAQLHVHASELEDSVVSLGKVVNQLVDEVSFLSEENTMLRGELSSRRGYDDN